MIVTVVRRINLLFIGYISHQQLFPNLAHRVHIALHFPVHSAGRLDDKQLSYRRVRATGGAEPTAHLKQLHTQAGDRKDGGSWEEDMLSVTRC